MPAAFRELLNRRYGLKVACQYDNSHISDQISLKLGNVYLSPDIIRLKSDDVTDSGFKQHFLSLELDKSQSR